MINPMTMLKEMRQQILNQTPGSPEAEKNQKRIETVAGELKKYFGKLNDSFPYDEMTPYTEQTSRQAVIDDISNLLIPTLIIQQPMLNNIIQTNAYRCYIDSARDFIKANNLNKVLPIEDAIEYASKRSASMIKNIDETTRKKIMDLVAKNLKDNKSIDDLARAIQAEFEGMSKSRAYAIARTETADALGEASMKQAKDEGLEQKAIILGANACEICIENESDGWIEMDEGFSSGDDRAPFHPNCVCTNIFRRRPL